MRIRAIDFQNWTTERLFMVLAVLVVLVIYLVSLNVPVFGDAFAYGYRSARWMSDNGLAFVPQGAERGEQAMGHPTVFFWLWAILMSLLGDSMAVTRLLPAIATLFAITGTYMLGRDLGRSRWAGLLAAGALLVSPLFITQSMRPFPDSSMVACVAWSLYFYRAGRYTSAALSCFAAVVFREQAVFLAAAYFIAELIHNGVRSPVRLLLFASPLLAIVITGMLNLAANGYFFFPSFVGARSTPLSTGLILSRLRFFAGHLLAEDFRWLIVVTPLSAMMAVGRKKGLPLLSILVLLVPALLYPPGRLAYILVVSVLLIWHLIRKGTLPDRTVIVMVLFPTLLVLFYVFIVLVSPDPALNLFRYVIGAYPVILAGAIALLWRYMNSRSAAILGCIFVAATASSNTAVHYEFQPETSLACLAPLFSLREAYSFASESADSVILSETSLEMAGNPGLGYSVDTTGFRAVGEGYPPLAQDVSYAVVISTFDGTMTILDEVKRLLPEGSRLEELPVRVWSDGPFRTYCYLISPSDPVEP